MVGNDRVKQWLLIGSITFGLGLGLGWFTDRNLKRAVLTGAITLPAVGAAAVLAEKLIYGGSATATDDSSTKPILAVFWDYENVRSSNEVIGAALVKTVNTYAVQQGHLQLKKIYSNWRREENSITRILSSLGFEQVQVSMGKQNSVDIRLAVDCLTAAYHYPDIQHFIIVSADKDYIPLVHALRVLGKKVTIMGRTGSISKDLLISADEFVPIEALMNGQSAAELKTAASAEVLPAADSAVESSPLDGAPSATSLLQSTDSAVLSYEAGIDCLLEAIALAKRQGQNTTLPNVDRLMRTIDRFDYRGVSSIQRADGTRFGKFGKFITAVEADGKVQQQIIEDLQQLVLIEDSIDESNPAIHPVALPDLSLADWQLLLEQVEQAFAETIGDEARYGRFGVLLHYIRRAKKNGQLNQSAKVLHAGLNYLIQTELLVLQDDRSLRLADPWYAKKAAFLAQQGTDSALDILYIEASDS